MSFRIFAVGHPHFHFERANNADDDLFEAANVANALRASAPSVTGAGSGVATYATPNSLLDATNAFATMQFLGLLKQSVELLALRTSARHGWISVAPRESHILWPIQLVSRSTCSIRESIRELSSSTRSKARLRKRISTATVR